ncbi:MAG: hypothetical protein LBL50_01825 [Candidatus Margulisbacteria bacterium]|jgi:hypothetical protein|nr:hypothetical protein [Candidatus Margulisiibacteriota bacterium]
MANAGDYTDATDTDFKGASYNIDTGKSLSAAGVRAALHTKENIANKQLYSTDAAGTLSSSSSDSYYPSAKLVGANLETKENIANKIKSSNNLSASSMDDQYPSAKLVYNELQAIKNGLEILPVGTILMYDGANWADNSTLPGWYSCISTNVGKGCPNLVDSFIKGTDSATKRGAAGNTGNEVTISADNLPTHTHSVSIDTDTKGAHRHGLRSTASDLIEATHGFHHSDNTGTNKNAIPVSWAYNISTDYYETFRETTSSSTMLYAMSETGGHEHTVSGSTGNNTTTAAKLSIEPQSYKLIYIRKCE